MDKANGTGDGFSLTTLRRWSCGDSTRLPAKEEIKALHVYDFDNTLFSSPLPNKQLWAPATIGQLQAQDLFVNGGWWHDSSILAATGNGVEVEETRAWERWWNEQTVELVKLSMAQKDALCVLLTGRSEASFPPLIKRIIAAKGLRFDLLCLKPDVGPDGVKFHSTMHFKQAFLATLIRTYSLATTIRIYEDRIKHVQGFRKFFDDFNLPLLQQSAPHGSPLRQPITADVVHVAEEVAHLEPDAEVAAVQRMINIHNTAVRNGTAPHPSRSMRIQRKIVFTAYLIAPDASARLQSLVQFPANMPPTAHDDVKMLANGIVIVPRPADPNTLTRVGGVGHAVQWRVTGLAVHENRIWAARVVPTNSREKVYTHTRPALVVLALRIGSLPQDANRIQHWQPVSPDQSIVFDSAVGEKVQLRIEDEAQAPRAVPAAGFGVDASDGPPPGKRVNMREQDFIPLGGASDGANRNDDSRRPNAISANHGARGGGQPGRGRGGRAQGRQGGFTRRDASGGGGGRGRGRGGPHGGYKSLDDVGGARRGGYPDYDGGGNNGYGEGRAMEY